MSEEDLAMIAWLKNAAQEEILAAMDATEKEIIREPIE